MSESLELSEKYQSVSEFNESSYDIRVFKQSYDSSNGFIVSLGIFQEPPRNAFKSEYLTPFIDFDETASWLMRVKLNKEGMLEQGDTKNNSVFIWYEWPEAVLEYAPE